MKPIQRFINNFLNKKEKQMAVINFIPHLAAGITRLDEAEREQLIYDWQSQERDERWTCSLQSVRGMIAGGIAKAFITIPVITILTPPLGIFVVVVKIIQHFGA
jgi:hypothetical protein